MTPLRRCLLLLPGHGPEDLPEEFEEDEAASLLNAAAAAWHPALVRRTDATPHWDRADDPPPVYGGTVVFIPTCVQTWIPEEWRQQANDRGAVLLEGLVTRDQYRAAIAAMPTEDDQGDVNAVPDGDASTVDPPHPLEDDFLAFGTCAMHLIRLARRLHIFDDLDGDRMWGHLTEAAGDVDVDAARIAMTRAFEALLEFRERLYPVDASLVDLVLVDPEQADALAAIVANASTQTPVNLMGDVDEFAALGEHAAFRAAMDAAGDAIDLVLGEPAAHPTMLAPLDRTAATLADARRRTFDATGRKTRVWGRRELALRAQLPTVLKGCGFDGAFHIGFSLGDYPDDEDARLDWVAPDNTPIAACSRLPLPSGRAASMWTFPIRLGESMEQDYAAVGLLVRFAGGETQWLDDLRRANAYGPIFGPLVTVSEFFSSGSGGARQLKPDASAYRSATLPLRAAQDDPHTHYAEHDRWTAAIETTTRSVLAGLAELATGQRPEIAESDESTIEGGRNAIAKGLAKAIAPGEPSGLLCLNATPRERVAVVPTGHALDTGPLAALQQGEPGDWLSLVKVPPLGYAWVPFAAADRPNGTAAPLVVEDRLQNEFFQLRISDKTGGIQSVRAHGSREILLSQQLGYVAEGESEPSSRMVADAVTIDASGPLFATATAKGRLLPADSDEPLATFRQTVTVTRGQRTFRVAISLDPIVRPDGPPWANYYACRWAWNAAGVAVSQSSDWDVTPSPSPTRFDPARLEAPLFLEVADEPRITILPHGQTFHLRPEGRLLESLLVTRGSDAPIPSFGVAIGEPHPAEAALDAQSPLAFAASARPAIESAWLAQLSQPGTLLLAIDPSPNPRQPGLVFLVRETEGRRGNCRLSLCRAAKEAFTLDWMDQPSGTLPVVDGGVDIPLRGHDLKRVFVSFG